jgi:hypothetical protein
MSDITNLDDARIARRMGLAAPAPVEQGVTSKATVRYWTDIEKSGLKFERVVASLSI